MQPIRRSLTGALALVALVVTMAGCGVDDPVSPITITSLPPARLVTVDSEAVQFTASSCPDHGSPYPLRPPNADQALVGRDVATRNIPYSATNGFEQCQTTWLVYEAAVVFDLSHLHVSRIGRATLSFRTLSAGGLSCATRLDLADTAVASPSDSLTSERYLALPPPDPRGIILVNVTSAVDAWAGHQRLNDGFALIGPTLDDGGTLACVSDFGDFALVVTP